MVAVMGNNLLATLAIYCAVLGCFGSMICAQRVQFDNEKSVPLPTDRLPTYVKPTRYHINLDFSNVMDSPTNPTYYSGDLLIDVQFYGPKTTPLHRTTFHKFTDKLKTLKTCIQPKVLEDSIPADNCPMFKPNRIVMHADKDVTIGDTEVIIEDSRGKRQSKKIVQSGRDAAKELISFELAENLPEGGRSGQIKLKFVAPIRDGVHGVYMSTAKRNEHVYRHIVAKFQPTFARLAFPCFDEPSFKAEFDFTIKYDISKEGRPMDAYATMDGTKSTIGNYHITQFERSPPMSVHMVAFIVGSFNQPPLVEQIRPDLQLRFLGIPGHLYEGEFAMEVAKKALAWFENYIGHKFPLKKLDIVAIADTDQDNTETWGLVFVREPSVVMDKDTQFATHITAAVNVAHVVVHQWFANLVTADFWDNLWLTENVAAEMAYQIVDELYPAYQSEYLVRISTLSGLVLARDKSGTQSPISPPLDKLTTSAEIWAIFDFGLLAFMKSGAIARMMQHTLGFEHYQLALRKIVAKYQYKNFNFENFIECIKETAEPNQDMVAVEQTLRSFSKLTGFPLINVGLDASGRSLNANLEPFHKAGLVPNVDSANEWRTPLNVLVSDASGLKRQLVDFEWDPTSLKAVAKLPDWFNLDEHFLKVQPNPDFSTYYRIRYSDELFDKLKTPIEEKKLSPMDRLHILDDANALVTSQLIANDKFRDLFDWQQNEDNPAMIIEMLLAAQTLAKLSLTKDKYPQQSPSNKVFATLYAKYGFAADDDDQSALTQRARSASLKVLVNQGVEQVIEEAVATFVRGDVAPFLREPVYAAVVKDGNQGRLDKLADQLFDTDSPEEKSRLASALALSDNTSTLERLANALNEPYKFKPTPLAQIVASSPRLAISNGKVVVVPKK